MEADRYKLVSDDSGHDYAIPVLLEDQWDAWRALPSDDPAAWEAPSFAIPVEGDFTFTDPQPR